MLIGGKRIPGRGYFYEPTLITGLSQEMEVWREETFGPVIFVRSFETEEEAIQLANNVSHFVNLYHACYRSVLGERGTRCLHHQF